MNNNECSIFPASPRIFSLPIPENLEQIRLESQTDFLELQKKVNEDPRKFFINLPLRINIQPLALCPIVINRNNIFTEWNINIGKEELN